MKTIKILGSCCSNCDSLENNVKLALEKSGIEANLIKVTNIEEITSYSIMSIPAIVIDEKVISSGKVLSVEEIIKILNGEIGTQSETPKKSGGCCCGGNC